MQKWIDKKILIILAGFILLAVGFSYAVYAAGVVFFGGSAAQTVVSFTTVGTASWTVPDGVTSVEVLVVAGGGGTGFDVGGGGGGGGVVYHSAKSVTPGQSYTVTVGGGGSSGQSGAVKGGNGGNSIFADITAIGGGGGGAYPGNGVGLSGGSGGGGGDQNAVGGSATQGNSGGGTGYGYAGGTSAGAWGGAGGGGAGGVGQNGITGQVVNGGQGYISSISGSSVEYGKGGKGNSDSGVVNPTPANVGEGAMGTGSPNNSPYSGGSGIVIIRYGKSKIAVSSIESGLVGYWALDGDGYNASTGRVTDKTPFEHHGINNGATLTTDQKGQTNGAMSFNGVNNYISINYTNPVKQTSVVAWFKRAGTPAGGYHIVTGGSEAEISIPEGGSIRTGVVTNTQGRQVFDSGSGLVDGGWHQVAFTYDGANLRSFIDGHITATNPVSGDLSGTAREIGRYLSNSYAANGSISDVRIYNRALSTNEIETLYNSYKPKAVAGSLQQGLILDMPLTSSYTKTVTAGSQIMTDRTPYSHDGQNYGGVVSAEGTLLANTGNRIETTFAAPNKQGTISIWYKPTYSSTDSNRSSNLYSTGGTWVANSFAFDIRNCCGAPYDNIMYMMDPNSNYLAYEWDNSVWQANEWINLTFVYDSKNYSRLYQNGVLVISNFTQNTTDFAFPNVFNIGAISAGGNSAKGMVSNLKVYDRVLSVTEIKSLYDKGR